MAHEEGLPGIGESQEIGQDATRCLHTNAPRNWVTPKDLGGTDDYGLDFQIQLKAQSQAAAIFRLQLKGTKSPRFIEDGKFISIPLSASTLRYYRNISEPILLVVCDLSVDHDPRNCPLYYVWVREELRRINVDSLDLDQIQVSLRVPTANQLSYELDLLQDVCNANELAEAGHALDVRVADLRPELQPEQRVAMVQNLTEGLKKRSTAFLEAVAAPVSEHWPNPEVGTLAADLIAAAKLLKTGKMEKAREILDGAQAKLKGAVDLELGEYHFLKGRLSMLSGDEDAASAAFLTAAHISGHSKYWAGWAESEIRKRYDPDLIKSLDFSDVLDQLPDKKDPVLTSIKARLLAASNKPEEARAVLAWLSDAESMTGLAIIETMVSKWEAAIAACDLGLADSQCSESSRLLFHILRARNKYYKALSTTNVNFKGDEFIPPTGPSGVDVCLLRESWSDLLVAVEAMDETNWASNSEFVADVLAGCATMLGKQKEAFTILRSAVRKRLTSQALNASLEVIAAHCGEFETALEANSRLDLSETQILHRIAFLYESGKQRRECVALTEQELPNISRNHPLFGTVLVLAARAAHDMAREDLVKIWSGLLESEDHLRPYAAILDYYLSIAKNPLGSSEALGELYTRHEELGRPMPIAITLFAEIDSNDHMQAKMLLDISKELSKHIRIDTGMSVHLAMALATLREWSQLLQLCDKNLHEFDTNPRLVAFKGLALDRLGNTEGARQVLKSMLDGSISDSLALSTYVNIMVRCGFFDEALEAAEQTLVAANSPAQKRNCIRLMFNLVQTKNPNDSRLVDLAIRMGELSDPTNEVEEGVFLAMVFAGTSASEGNFSPEKEQEIKERAETFFKRFPNSKVLWRIDIGNVTGDKLLQQLKEVCGISEDRQRALMRMEREMREGKLPIPFAWRPKFAFSNIRDQLHLWEISKQVTPDDKQFHLIMETAEWKPKCADDLRGKIPLIDLTTLFVLFDLDLLDALFKQFQNIAIAQSTLAELWQLCQVFSGSPGRNKCLELQRCLREKLGQIIQPIAQAQDEENSEYEQVISLSAKEIKTLCTADGYFLYSDDVIFRVWCLGEAVQQHSMSTLDLLEVLEEKIIIDRLRAARVIAKLCSWNVGVKILLKYQLAIIPQSAIAARNISESVERLQRDKDFMHIATGMWDFRSDFQRNFWHVAAVLRDLINQPSISTLVAASFAGIWYLKAKIRHDCPHPLLTLLVNLTLKIAADWIGGAAPVNPDNSRRLLQVFIHLVELEYGNRMDEESEKHALRELARRAAELDSQLKEKPSPLRTWILAGLVSGTSLYDIFSEAYNTAYTNLAVLAEREGK